MQLTLKLNNLSSPATINLIQPARTRIRVSKKKNLQPDLVLAAQRGSFLSVDHALNSTGNPKPGSERVQPPARRDYS